MTAVVVRNSELTTWRKCRQQWAWAYMERRQATRPGRALVFGNLVHDVLELFYPPGLKRGGKPHELWEQVWEEFEKEHEDFEAIDGVMASELGYAMLKGYWDEYGKDDAIKIIQAEQPFQIDIYDPLTGNYRGILVGTLDAIGYDRKLKKYMILEHKTGSGLENFGAPLIMDEQAGTYWAFGPTWIEHMGIKLSGEGLAYILYNRLKKALPDERPVNEEGFSLNKNGAVSKRQPQPRYLREKTFRGQEDRESVIQRISDQMREISLVKRGKLPIYKNPSDACKMCAFRATCEAHEIKTDWQAVLKGTTVAWNPYEGHDLPSDLTATNA